MHGNSETFIPRRSVFWHDLDGEDDLSRGMRKDNLGQVTDTVPVSHTDGEPADGAMACSGTFPQILKRAMEFVCLASHHRC